MATKPVTIDWDSTDTNFPAGTVAGQILVSISGGKLAAPLTMLVDTTPATFQVDEEAAGDPDYTVTVQRQDGAGGPLGAALSGTFSVLEPPAVVISIPSTLRISVGA